jgi:nicotinamide-nucleotide amidase
MSAADLKPLLQAKPRLTLAVAESLTCGRVQAAIGAVSGASEYFLGGVTAYTIDQKVELLGVNRRVAARVNCVSTEVAQAMAQGACRLFGSDLALATTGYAEPSPKAGVAAPFAWWAIAHRRRGRFVALRTGRIECPGEPRVEVQQMVAAAVIAELVGYLKKLRGE